MKRIAPVMSIYKLGIGAEILLPPNRHGWHFAADALFQKHRRSGAFERIHRTVLPYELHFAVLFIYQERKPSERGIGGSQRFIDAGTEAVQIGGILDLRKQIHIDDIVRDLSEGQIIRSGKRGGINCLRIFTDGSRILFLQFSR